MDLPPVVPPSRRDGDPPPPTPPVPALAPGATPLPTPIVRPTITPQQLHAFREQQRIQRGPSFVHFTGLLLLYLYMSSNNQAVIGLEEEDPNTAGDGLGVFGRMKKDLDSLERQRDSLARWVGEPERYTNTTHLERNATASATNETTNFTPANYSNPALLGSVKEIMEKYDNQGSQIHFHQNLTGHVRGKWKVQQEWTYEKLGMTETYNWTRLERKFVEQKGGESGQDISSSSSSSSPSLSGSASPSVGMASERDHQLVPRQLSPFSPVPRRETHLVNTTSLINRTEGRGDFEWMKGGNVRFTLTDSLKTIVGPVRDEGHEGEVLKLREVEKEWEKEGPVTYITGEVALVSHDGGYSMMFDVEGVHFLSQGKLFAVASPQALSRSYFFDVPGVVNYDPSSTKGNRSALAAGEAILKEADTRIAYRQEELEHSGAMSYTPSAAPVRPPLIFSLHASISPLPSSYSPALYAEYYASLSHPTGSNIRPPPSPVFSWQLYSQSTGLVITSDGPTRALPVSVLWDRMTVLATLASLVQVVILLLVVKQIQYVGGAGSLMKVASLTVGMQAFLDVLIFLVMFSIGATQMNRAAIPTLVPAALAFMSATTFGTSYAARIRAAAPPPLPRPLPPPPPPPPIAQDLAADAAQRRADSSSDMLPLLGGATPALLDQTQPPNDGISDVQIGLIMAFSTFAFIFAIVFIGWAPMFLTASYSYWLPQIHQNVRRGAARMSLRRDYIVGTTIARLVAPLYLYGCPANLMEWQTSGWIVLLVLYSSAQAVVLLLQDSRFGARFFLNQAALDYLGIKDEPTWNYHPVLHSEDLEGGHLAEDCPICMEPIEIGDKEEMELGVGVGSKGKGRWGYMVPPCHHIAHSHCLESWLAIKSVCPVCRARLPPI